MKLRTRFLLLLALGILSQIPATAQAAHPPDHFDPDHIDSYLASEALRKGRVGLSVAIIKDDKPALVKGYGLASRTLVSPAKRLSLTPGSAAAWK
jgi:hypothetical protein